MPHGEKYFLPPSIAPVTSMEDDPQPLLLEETKEGEGEGVKEEPDELSLHGSV